MKNIFVKICDLFLLTLLAGICLLIITAISPWLFLRRRSSSKFKHQGNRLLLLPEAGSFEASKAKGNLSLLTKSVCNGYFEKVYFVHFPTPRSQTIHLTDRIVFMEIKSILRFLKRYNFIFSYTLINSLWYFFNIFLLRGFALENANIIRGAGLHHTALAALFLHRLTDIPVCISVHSDDEKRYKMMQKYGGIWEIFNCRWFTIQIHKFVFTHAPRIFLVRESLKDWALRMGASPERIRLFPHGMNIQEFFQDYRENIKSEFGLSSRKLVVFAGRLSEENYVDDIIKIAELVCRDIANVLFLLIGDGPERKRLEALVNRQNLQEYVRFIGFQPQAKIFELRKRADVNLCLMAGYSLIEAALSAKPIVAYDVEWHYELVRNGKSGYLVAEHDVNSAAQAVISLINNSELAKNLGKNAYRLAVERHDIEKTDREKVKLYEELKQKFPLRIEIEPTNKCNSYCSYCPRRFMQYKVGFMDMGLYRKLINEISAYPERTLVLFRRGEALLHPNFAQMLQYAKGKFRDIQLATNASLMDKGLAHIIAECVSFISFSLELPQRYGNCNRLHYHTVTENVIYFLSINRNTKTQVSLVKTDDINKEDIESFKRQWLGKVDRVRLYEEHSNDGRFGSLKSPRGPRKPCVKPFNDILIFWDGRVGRCNHDWGQAPLDSVQDKTIREVWQSPTYQKLRKQHTDLIITDKVCQKCDSWYGQLGVCKIGEVYEKDSLFYT